MMPQPPPGQGPIDPRGAFTPPGAPPPSPTGAGGAWRPVPPMPPMPPYMNWPRPGGGFARGIFVTLATTIFGMSLALNVYLLLISGLTGAASTPEETVIIPGSVHETIAVVPISGEIDTKTFEQFGRIMDRIEKDANVKALVLEINTPGGEVTASDDIYQRILRFKAKKGLPVVATMGAMATSGGYYVACGADQI
ncbi:MAG: S49 family peptidase, partial [Tepidisphaeraceae bacterium]